jgi:hypothetical protein
MFKRHLYDHKNRLYYIEKNINPPEVFLLLGYDIDTTEMGYKTYDSNGMEVYSFNDINIHFLAEMQRIKFKITPTKLINYEMCESDICNLVKYFFVVI